MQFSLRLLRSKYLEQASVYNNKLSKSLSACATHVIGRHRQLSNQTDWHQSMNNVYESSQ